MAGFARVTNLICRAQGLRDLPAMGVTDARRANCGPSNHSSKARREVEEAAEILQQLDLDGRDA